MIYVRQVATHESAEHYNGSTGLGKNNSECSTAFRQPQTRQLTEVNIQLHISSHLRSYPPGLFLPSLGYTKCGLLHLRRLLLV
jgi:hypothetical protein